jgi:hypothetical protein
MSVASVFTFPDPVNERSARFVAAGAAVLAVAFLFSREGWLLVPLVYGFLARVLTGPTLSPLGQLSTRVLAPLVDRRLGPGRHVPGPPKRFAQGVGLGFSGLAALAWIAGFPLVSAVLISLLAVAATLESVFALCLGCIAYSALWGCEDCHDISDRLRTAIAESQCDSVPA